MCICVKVVAALEVVGLRERLITNIAVEMTNLP